MITRLTPIRLLAVLCTFALTATVLSASEVEIRLDNGIIWRGDLSETVKVVYTQNNVERTFEGVLKNYEQDYNYIVVTGEELGSDTEKVLFLSDVRSIQSIEGNSAMTPARKNKDTSEETGDDSTPNSIASTKDADASGENEVSTNSDWPGVFVLPLEGTVGIGLRNEEMDKMADHADKFGKGQVIVLVIDSPGGLVVEGDMISDSLLRIKKDHRLVAWIKRAISGAAFTALHCDEIYFKSEGTLGAITMFSGETAISGARLDAWLKKLGEVAEAGGRSPYPAQSMATNSRITSYTKDPVTGEVTWYNDLSGEVVLSDGQSNLVFNARNAEDSKFSDGTADTKAELARLMQLPEWKEADDYGRELFQRWQSTLEQARREVPLIAERLQYKDQGGDAETVLGTQIRLFNEALRWWDRAPNYCRYEAGMPPKQRIERQLAELKKQLGDLRRNRRSR